VASLGDLRLRLRSISGVHDFEIGYRVIATDVPIDFNGKLIVTFQN